ncbi:glycosyltransferase [Chitinophaga sedimenti]|uniref:glycosyltransferase n=1 Tax=Chitinophaga sedimenti TaxID=2033606 RepID=UPI00200375FA|nr:glycosyltransferase [Chitinophaga sedimenti]MCK7558000.1 glycosyltransferase [Chitinophaga sedimenti]
MKPAVIILTLNESKHIGRCLESLRLITDDIYIVDAGSKDDTIEIAHRFGAKVFHNPWISYAKQFQWALDNCGITAPWIMRMDSDEYRNLS